MTELPTYYTTDEAAEAWTEGYKHGLAQCNHHPNEPRTQALVQTLTKILDGTEWNGDVLDEISQAFDDAGLNLRSPDSP